MLQPESPANWISPVFCMRTMDVRILWWPALKHHPNISLLIFFIAYIIEFHSVAYSFLKNFNTSKTGIVWFCFQGLMNNPDSDHLILLAISLRVIIPRGRSSPFPDSVIKMASRFTFFFFRCDTKRS